MRSRRSSAGFYHYHISAKDRDYFINNLALLLKANVGISEALGSLMDTSRSGRFRAALAHMQQDIDEGVPLWKSMERSGLVSKQTLVLIKLGEASGSLVENLHKAAQQEDKQRLFKTKVRSAMLYPTIVLAMAAVSAIGVAWFLLPRLSETFNQLDAELPLISQILLQGGIFLKENGVWAVPSLVLTLAACMSLVIVVPSARRFGQRLQIHIPGINTLLREIEIARFGYLFGTLLDAGLPVTESIALLADATKSPQYQKLYMHLHQSFEEGYSFKNSLARYSQANGLLPPAMQQMLIAGERSGSLPETLLNIGQIYEEKSDVTTKNLEVITEPVLLIIIGGAVLTIMLAVLMPIYGLVNQVSAG